MVWNVIAEVVEKDLCIACGICAAVFPGRRCPLRADAQALRRRKEVPGHD